MNQYNLETVFVVYIDKKS